MGQTSDFRGQRWCGAPLLRAAAASLVLGLAAIAAEPKLDHLYPAAGQQGTTVSVTPTGKFDPWPPQVWVDAPGIQFKPASSKGKFDVEIAKDAPPGPHLVRFFNKDGASQPRFFIVSTEPETLEKEPNDDYKAPQVIPALPATISGRLDKQGDVDSFAVTLKKGQTLTAWLEAYVLASKFDGMLRIVDTNGVQLAFNHDGRTLDPYLSWDAPSDGTFVVQLMGFAYPATQNPTFTGGPGCVYRLHLTTAPQPRFSFPPHETSQGEEIKEQEPNDTPATAQNVPIPCSISACINKDGDQDRYAFTAQKGKIYTFQVYSARAGTPLDAWLLIENKDGKQLARNDDAEGSKDPQLTWTAPSDGTFIAAIGDMTHHGGPAFIYRLNIAEATPTVTATATNHSIIVNAGKTAEFKATIKRTNGFQSKLVLTAKNLPTGLTAPDVEVPAKDGEVVLKVTADKDAAAVSQPLRLALREPDTDRQYPVIYSMITTEEVNGVLNGYTELVINSTDQLWLTVIAAPPPPATPTPPKESPKSEPPKVEPAKPDPAK